MHVVRFSDRTTEKLAIVALSRGLSHGQARRFHRTLETRPADRRAYNHLADLFCEMQGGSALSEGQHRRILGQVKAATGAHRPRRRQRSSWLGLLRPIAPVVALAVLVLIPLSFWSVSRPAGTLEPRGSSAPAATLGTVSLEVHCIRGGEVVSPPVRSGPHTPDALCRVSDELQLSLTNRSTHRYLLVLGQRLDGPARDTIQWYYPLPPNGQSGLCPSHRHNEPLGQALRLSVNHRPGRVRLVAVLSAEPLNAEVLHAWLGTLPRHGDAAALLNRLTGHRRLTVIQKTMVIRARGETP